MYADPTGYIPEWLADIGRFFGGLGIIAGSVGLIASTIIAGGWLCLVPGYGTLLQSELSILMYGGYMISSSWNSTIQADMEAVKWNPFNKDVNAAANSSIVSFYKGSPIIRTNRDSLSFGIIFLSKSSFYGSSGHYWTPSDILKHEYGHIVQLMSYGALPYLINIGIPSIFMNDDDKPWEIVADLLGGVKRNYDPLKVKKGMDYFLWGRFVRPFWWW